MADPTEPLVQTCATCGALIDVTDEEPFALMHCPNCGTGMRVRRRFDHFELQEPLGSGGMGTVYRALDTTLNRMVALKLLRKEYSEDPVFVQQFQTEAAITGSINHPNVVKVYSTGNDHGLLYIAMELVDKGSLDELMDLQGRVPEAQVLGVGIQIAKGLDAALQRGLIHRDIKPGNILFADAHTAKIVDFGLAVLMEHAGQDVGEVWGTPYYVAPEKLDKLDRQSEDHRSDIYSLGASLFHALAGRPPFEAETASMVALKHVRSQAVSLQAFAPDVSSATAFVINKTLNKNPDDRYQSYGELVEHLEYARNELLDKVGNAAKKARLVLESENEQTAVTWITVGIIALIVATGVAAFVYRDRIWKTDNERRGSVQAAPAIIASIDSRYRDARQLALEGKPEAAAEELGKLDADPKIPQPLHNWITVYAGLAQLLAGREVEARNVFARIEERGGYSSDPTDKKLSEFFLDLGGKMTRDAPIPAAVAKDYEKTSHQGFALLLFALKNWELEHYGEAGPLFRQFQSVSPQVPKNWFGDADEIATLKKVASEFVNDFTQWREIADLMKSAKTLAERKEVLEKVKAARSALQRKGTLAEFFARYIAQSQKEIAAEEGEQTKKTAEQEAADAHLLTEAKRKAEGLARHLKFGDARGAVVGLKVESEKAKREHDGLTRRYDSLARFKSMLINDLNTAGYPNPIARRTGSPLPGGVNKADEAQVYIRTPYGGVPVGWTDLAPETIYAMAASFIRAGLPPEMAADRKWMLGVYALLINRTREGRALLADAAQTKREYSEAMPLLIESAEAR